MPLSSQIPTPPETIPMQLDADQQASLNHAMGGELSPSDAAAIVQELRRQNAESGAGIDAILLQRIQHLVLATQRAEQIQAKFKEES